jgi:hypothetical protein
MVPALTRAAGVPRLAGISYPMGRPMGMPHDADGQRAVLRRTLELLTTASAPGTYVELLFEWPESPARARNASKDAPPAPIVDLLRRKPWLLPMLYSGRIPHESPPSTRELDVR